MDDEKAASDAELALRKRLQTLEAQLKDERKGAQLVNSLLTHFFGHGGLRLDAVDIEDGVGVKFQIFRGSVPAFHLSEGECSLIAFCYFMALLQAPDSSGKELIVYIDDPISSLDSNHIYFMFSLIESLLAEPERKVDNSLSYRYKQLFISTHNLDFLKYLKNLSAPKENSGGTQHFIVEKHGDNPSRLTLMPDYLRGHVTEFNYLFHQIYRCAQPRTAEQGDEHYYSFGNNLRKFLEAYLFFKYPTTNRPIDSLSKLRQFFGNDGPAVILANRLNNEMSHLQESFDRCMRPIDIPEIQTLAQFVLAKIKEADAPQYDALVESIGGY